MEPISYSVEPDLTSDEFVDVLRRSTLAERRPVDDAAVIEGMPQQADLIVTARNSKGILVGVARSLTDFHYCAYLSDLAVDSDYQRRGIGKALIDATHDAVGSGTMLILLAAPAAVTYYPHIGMEQHNSCWIRRPVDSGN